MRITASRIVSRGFQPRDRILVVSRKMNGLSPTQPLTPRIPALRGEAKLLADPPQRVVDRTVLLGPEVEDVDRLLGGSMARNMASMQSCT